MAHNEKTCRVCRFHNRVKMTAQNGSRNQMRKLLMEMYENVCMEHEEASVYRAILDGSWPNAKEILERSLKKLNDKPCTTCDNGGCLDCLRKERNGEPTPATPLVKEFYCRACHVPCDETFATEAERDAHEEEWHKDTEANMRWLKERG